ncbi:MAG TPA: phage terminase large subunit [Hyphomonadaceae bacterium]|nr:phage terminase large subunit [Hyphomonadaceae bacterium]
MRNDLATFFRMVIWRVLKPHEQLLWAPFLDLLCAKLQAVAEGKISRLIITVPPRFGKSLVGSVALPAFFLGNNPAAEVMCVSYAQELARQFGEMTRRVMASLEYLALFGVQLVSNKASPMLLKTTAGGNRRATSIDGSATGMGAHLMVFDDPQKPGEMLSDAIRRSTNSAYENTFLSRQNDPRSVRIVIIMQRTHEDDFVGHVTGLGGDWTVINLPAIAEATETWTYETFLGTHSWTRKEGESLHPARFPAEDLLKVRAEIGEAAWATQWLQRPAPAGGGLVQGKWFRRCPFDKLPETFDQIIQSWDTANTTAEWSNYCVCTTWGIKDKTVYLINVFRERMLYPDLKRSVIERAAMFDAVAVLIENQASGKQLLQELPRDGFTIALGVDPDGDKQMRMASQTAIIANGFVVVPDDVQWAREYMYEMEVFPNGKYDDQVDSTSQFLTWFNNARVSHWALREYYRQLAEGAAKSSAKAMATVHVPPEIVTNTFILMDGQSVRPDADGLIRTTAENARSLLRVIGITLVEGEI